ncbi:hypothetical protein AB0H36_09765 [Kribbella sp. NPDC050820]|uniref:hypothetical protein n=1 Tax=Kribbella sp. NPDC050820 TaxID=3155408 RepID=UPI003404C3FC
MTDRVIVDEDGVWLTDSGRRFGYPWSELTGAGISVLLLPPDAKRLITVEVDHVSGDFLSITDGVEGFKEAVEALVARSGGEPPNLATLSPEDTVSIALVAESPSA